MSGFARKIIAAPSTRCAAPAEKCVASLRISGFALKKRWLLLLSIVFFSKALQPQPLDEHMCCTLRNAAFSASHDLMRISAVGIPRGLWCPIKYPEKGSQEVLDILTSRGLFLQKILVNYINIIQSRILAWVEPLHYLRAINSSYLIGSHSQWIKYL